MGYFGKFVANGCHARRSAARGFTLIELMCVITIFGIMTALSIFSVHSIMAGRQIANNAHELAGLIRTARTAAIAQNTYVAVAFSASRQGNSSVLLVATVAAKSGQLSDLQTAGQYQLLNKCAVLKDVQFASAADYINLPAVDETNNVDITDSARQLQVAVGGGRQLDFTNALVISPSGEITLTDANGTAAPIRCLGIGLQAAPASPNKPRLAAVQVAGLSGDVSVFVQ
ncbi:MAG: prepilin-type N-terminal cleavage/methylation domain-containing protein [Verrucomicrobiales bacterium]|jgi:prepilin-type N-terminal cleavage/methylation domain-containing protein|nr:prepilin-type N-terminal cleavage/methylation domain-containing protein [Verrucomicrobiales bacterium]